MVTESEIVSDSSVVTIPSRAKKTADTLELSLSTDTTREEVFVPLPSRVSLIDD